MPSIGDPELDIESLDSSTKSSPSEMSSEFEAVALEEEFENTSGFVAPTRKGSSDKTKVSCSLEDEARSASVPSEPRADNEARPAEAVEPSRIENVGGDTLTQKGTNVAADLVLLGVDEMGLNTPDSFGLIEDDVRPIFDEYANEVVKDLEKAGQKFAVLAKAAATDVSKLFAVSDAKGSLSKLSTGFSSWFGSFDNPAFTAETETKVELPSTSSAHDEDPSELQTRFSLPDAENILESFVCSLQQECSCSHNPYTTAALISVPGVLCVTDVHTCFASDDPLLVPPFKLAHKDVKTVVKRRTDKKGAPQLRLEFGAAGQYISIKDFSNPGGLDDALALIELKLEEL